MICKVLEGVGPPIQATSRSPPLLWLNLGYVYFLFSFGFEIDIYGNQAS